MAPEALSQVLSNLPTFDDPNLLVGLDTSDDAAVYKIDDSTAIIQSVDIFPPVVDNPYDYGVISAANALSDIYAMGGTPKLAMNILCIPSGMPNDLAEEILRGGYDTIAAAGAVICGGHSIRDDEPKYGLSVTGFIHPDNVIKNIGLQDGDKLILTKALGTGILNSAAKAGRLSEKEHDELVTSMKELNRTASEIMTKYEVHACTDITGFGLLGHGFEMAKGSDKAIRVDSSRIKILNGALEMSALGIVPGGAKSNMAWLSCTVDIDESVSVPVRNILFDPQTSGGLLFSLPEADCENCLSELTSAGIDAVEVAEVLGDLKQYDKTIYVI